MKGTRDLNSEFSLIKDVCDVETLCCRIPWMKGFFEDTMAIQRDLYEVGSWGRGSFTRMNGFAAGKEWRYRGRVPLSIVVAIEQLFPGFFTDDKRSERFFRENPQFSVVQRIH